MRISERSGKLCVIVRDHGPIYAAVFVSRNGSITRKKHWARGPRPSWLWMASRNMPTLLIDSELPTLANTAENAEIARKMLVKIGIGETPLITTVNGCAVAVKAENLQEVSESTLECGLVTDYSTSLAALELAAFVNDIKTADGARLTFHEGAAFLTVREGGRISVRRFSIPNSATELAASLKLYSGPQLVVGGILEINGFEPENRPGLTIRDMRIADKDATNSAILSLAAETYFSGDLAIFEQKHQRLGNIARRWLPPFSAALALLCLAALAPLANARAEVIARQEALAQMTTRKAEADARANDNREILARIEKLSIKRNLAVDGMMRTQRTLSAVMKVQDAKRAAKRLQLDTISIDKSGRDLTLSGSLPAGYSDELGMFVDKLGKAHFQQKSDIAMRENDGRLSFSVNMGTKR